MRSLPSGWNTVLAMLGFTRKRKSNKTAQRTVHRALRVEALEDRRMLATITVNTHLDVDDSNDGLTTLREAVVAAASSGDTINFAPDLSGAMITLDRVNLGQITIGKSLTIDASGLPAGITIDADDPTPGHTGDGIRIFNITDPSGGTNPPLVELLGLTLKGGDVSVFSAPSGEGGAILSFARLIIRDCIIEGNEADIGGAIYVEVAGGGATPRSVLTIIDSVIQGNDANTGAGVAVVSGSFGAATSDTMLISNTTISDNSSSFGNGGGLYAELYGADLTIDGGSVIALNKAGSGGGVVV